MKTRVMPRLAGATVLLAGVIGGIVASAPQAAAIGQCQSYQPNYSVTVSAPPNPTIFAVGWEYCIPGPGGIPYHITISKYIGNNNWQVVSTGVGEASYTCTGGRYLYQTNIDFIVGLANFYCG